MCFGCFCVFSVLFVFLCGAFLQCVDFIVIYVFSSQLWSSIFSINSIIVLAAVVTTIVIAIKYTA